MFDVREDYFANIQTVVTHATDIEPLKKEYQQTVQAIFVLAKQTNFHKRDQQRFKYQTKLLFSMGTLALNQLHAVQTKYGGQFSPERYLRRELVCDTARPVNWWKWFRAFQELTNN